MHRTIRVFLVLAAFAAAIAAPAQTQPEVFNADVYIHIYPDLLNALGGSNTQGAQNHWLCCGINEGRRASIIFDPVYYLNNNPDLLAAYGSGNYSQALQHWLIQGLPHEGRRGSLEFDVRYYLANNPDILAAYGPTGYQAAADHFLNYGLFEGRKGSADWDVKDYINIYPDVATLYVTPSFTNYYNATLHWLRRGKAAGRSGVGAPVISGECSGATPSGFSRLYLGVPASGSGNGTAANPFDGTTQAAFDGTLRRISEQTAPIPINPETGAPYGPTSLIVCIGAGTFQTVGNWDWVINRGHTLPDAPGTPNNPGGFTLRQNWHVHGAGASRTTLRLAQFLPNPALIDYPANTGFGEVFGTQSDSESGIEISDLTIDDNYPALKDVANQTGITALNLLAITLRSDAGNHWIHRVNVINAAGEVGAIRIKNEAFPILIQSVHDAPAADTSSRVNNNNLIEFVIMSNFGGHTGTAIVLGNAIGTVRYNVVTGATIGYGGWDVGAAYFYDNTAVDCVYGFNIDSLTNNGVWIGFNDFTLCESLGIVIGGPAPNTFANFTLLYNNVGLFLSQSNGLVLQGNVTNSIFARTNIGPSIQSSNGIDVRGSGNFGNTFQYNQIASSLHVLFESPSSKFQNCVYRNWTESGADYPKSDLTNTQSTPCINGL
jgi:hypothetical protein